MFLVEEICCASTLIIIESVSFPYSFCATHKYCPASDSVTRLITKVPIQ